MKGTQNKSLSTVNSQMSTKEVVIKTDRLTKRFGDFIATNEVTFEVYAGEILVS